MGDRQFVMKLDFAAGPAVVFRALTDAEELVRWFAPQAEVSPGPDGAIALRWDDDVRMECRIREWSPPQQLSMTWAEGGAADTQVSFRLSGAVGACEMRLVHGGFGPDDDAEYHSIARGWTIETRVLRHYLQRFPGADRYQRLGRVQVPDMSAARWKALAQRLSMPDPAVLRQGQHFPLDISDGLVPGATLLGGITDEDLLVELDALDGGLLRLSVESIGGNLELWLWVMTWNDRQSACDTIFEHMEAAARAIAG